MPIIEFAHHLRRHVDCAPIPVQATDLRAALDAAFGQVPGLRHYVLDDQAALRKHVALFVNGTMVTDRVRLDMPLDPEDRVYVVQALSGG